MGAIGRKLGAALGKGIGGWAGQGLGKYTGMHQGEGQKVGADIGGDILGALIPFKKGGRVKKNTKAMLHKGEYVLPRGVKPTKKQIKAVKKRGGKM